MIQTKTGKRYGCWAGNAIGFPEDPAKCVEEVQDTITHLFRQCSFKRGHGPDGLYCRSHAKIREKGNAK